MTMTEKWREELKICIENAVQITVSPKLYEATVDTWLYSCGKNEDILDYVFSQLFGHPFKMEDLKGASPRARRGIYKFTSKYLFPEEGKSIGHIVASILTEGEQEELLNAYYYRLLSRKARLEHKAVQWERDYQWIQEVLELLTKRNPALRLPEAETPVGEGNVLP